MFNCEAKLPFSASLAVTVSPNGGHRMCTVYWLSSSHPKGGLGKSDVSLLSGISGLSFDSTFLSLLLLFYSCCSFLPLTFFSADIWSFLLTFPQENYIFFVKKLASLYVCCLAARRSQLVGAYAARCLMALVFAVMHL